VGRRGGWSLVRPRPQRLRAYLREAPGGPRDVSQSMSRRSDGVSHAPSVQVAGLYRGPLAWSLLRQQRTLSNRAGAWRAPCAWSPRKNRLAGTLLCP
jgi:hypothetical protein